MNHIALLLDNSGSMNWCRQLALDAFNRQLEVIREQAASTGQETTVSLITFGLRVFTVFSQKAAKDLRPINWADYSADESNTRMFDAVGAGIDLLRAAPTPLGASTAYLLCVITDGEDNLQQTTTTGTIRRLLAELQGTDHWTFAFQVPPEQGGKSYKRNLETGFGIPAGNIAEWTSSVAGIKKAEEAAVQGVQNYFAGRAAGRTSTKKYFIDLANVSDKDIEKKLLDLSAHFKSWEVPKAGLTIEAFVAEKTKRPYITGSAYYPLVRPERLRPGRAILLQKHGEKRILGGPAVRDLLGLPQNEEVKLEAKNVRDYKVWIQSSSSNRILLHGARIYVDLSHQGGTQPTWVAPAPAGATQPQPA